MSHTKKTALLPLQKTPTRYAAYRKCAFTGCTLSFYAKGFCNSHYMQLRQGRALAPLQQRGGSQPKPAIPRLISRVRINGKPHEVASKIERKDSCWIWTRSKNSNGYGQLHVNGGMGSAHKASYEAFVGPIGAESVHHRCHTKACVNPLHLELATMRENVGEMFARKAYEKTINLQQTGIREALKQVEHRLSVLSTANSQGHAIDDEIGHLRTMYAALTSIPCIAEPTKPHTRPSRSRKQTRCIK